MNPENWSIVDRWSRWDTGTIRNGRRADFAVHQANLHGGYRGTNPYELVVRNDNGAVVFLPRRDCVSALAVGAGDHPGDRPFVAVVPLALEHTFMKPRLVPGGREDDRRAGKRLSVWSDNATLRARVEQVARLRSGLPAGVVLTVDVDPVDMF